MRNAALISSHGLAGPVTYAPSAFACTLCTTATGADVHAGIGADFALHFGATAAPFLVLFAIVTILQRGWPPWGGGA